MPATFETTVRPCRSTIGPRGASTRTRRSWLFWAAFRYSSPERTWSDQRRRKRTANTMSATAPRTPTRSARPGVSRYGSRTRGSGGRNRSDGDRRSRYAPSDNDLDLRRELPNDALVHDRADEQVDGEREHEVREQRRDENRHEREARDDVVAEHVMEQQGECAREYREHADRDHRRQLPAATARLHPATGPEPRERQDEGGDPERLRRRRWTTRRPPAAWRPRRRPPTRARLRRSSLRPLRRPQDDHRVEGSEVDVRLHLHLLEDVGVREPEARHLPDRDSLRVERAQTAGAPAGRHDLVSLLDLVLLADEVEDEGLARALRVQDDAACTRAQVDRGDGRVLVGQQLHACRPVGDARDEADEAVRGDDRVLHAYTVVGPRRDDDCARERARGHADDLGDDRVVVPREARAVDVVEQPSQGVVLLARELALDDALAELAILLLQAFRPRARVEEAVGPAVHVSEGLRDPLEADGERPQDGRAGGVDAREPAVLAGAKGEGDEDEREEHERAHGEAASKSPGASWRQRRGRKAPDGHAQRCGSRAASSGHDERV